MIWFYLAISLLVFLAVQRWKNYRGRPELIESFELPEFQAHRGYHLDGTCENTLKSLINAKKRGAQMSELDVQASFDGEVFLYHDASLQRLHGDGRRIAQMLASDLKAFGITTLKEVLESPETPAKLNIELKTSAIFHGRLENLVVQTLKGTKHSKKILFSSFNPFCLMRLHHLAPEIPRALIATKERAAQNYIFLRKLWLVPFCSPDLLHLDKKMLGLEHFKLAEKYKLRLAIWTPNSEEDILKLREQGVRHFISDRFVN